MLYDSALRVKTSLGKKGKKLLRGANLSFSMKVNYLVN